jgi:anti-anti-sigma factor
VLVPPLDIDIRLVDGVQLVSVRGELDLASAPALAERLSAAVESVPVEVDLAGVGFIDARGLRVLVAAHAQGNGAGGPGLRLVRASEPTRRLFELVGLARLLDADSGTPGHDIPSAH